MSLKLLGLGLSTVIFANILTYYGVNGELDRWEDYPVILTMDYDQAIFLTPDTGCHVVEDKRLMEKFLVRKNNVFRANQTTARDIIMLCKDFQNDKINASQFVISLHEKSFLIYPGTHFCGVGNNAKNDSDLGHYRETDICCREHDACRDSVSGWSCHPAIKELCNWAPFTRSNCKCDNEFRECLQRSTESAAHTIGTLFFSVFGLKCFRKDHPILECEEYGGFLNIHCQKYKLDLTKSPLYQFFDSPRFLFGTRQLTAFNDSADMEFQFPFNTKDIALTGQSLAGSIANTNAATLTQSPMESKPKELETHNEIH